MASDDPNHRRNRSTPQSYPLQDLSPSNNNGRLRALSDRGRDWVHTRYSPRSGSAYSPIIPGSTSPPLRATQGPRLVVPTDVHSQIDRYDVSPSSPVDGSLYQQAFSGLSFHDPFGPALEPPQPYSSSYASRTSPLPTISDNDSSLDPDEAENYFPSENDSNRDTTPLTSDQQPIAGTSNSATPSGQRHDRQRSRAHSVRFTPDSSPARARLGDDLARVEEGRRISHDGLRRTSMRRSLSPNTAGSALQRAGTIVRNMSQRVVNISNENDVVEHTLRRKSSSKASREGRPDIVLAGVPLVDGSQDGSPPLEKTPSTEESEISPPIEARLPPRPMPMPNPLRGKSFGIFGPENKIRLFLLNVLTHPVLEPIILALITLQVVLLVIDTSKSIYDDPDFNYPNASKSSWGSHLDKGLLGLFIIYTVEMICRAIVSGFMFNAYEYSTLNRQHSVKTGIVRRIQGVFGESRGHTNSGLSDRATNGGFGGPQPSLVRSFTSNVLSEQRGDHRYHMKCELARRAYLRHSFSRIDFLSVSAYWISFILALSNTDNNNKLYVFRMLSCLRILRLLWITNGTAVILRSLKKAAPLLVNVAILVGFFWLIFAIIGVQSFKASLRRQCVWTDPGNASNTWTSSQFCGGWIDENGTPRSWLRPDGKTSNTDPKGFWCPVNSKCVEGTAPFNFYNGTVSFDNIFQSMELVFVIMTSNTFSDLMYDLTNTDYLAAALFFAAGIIILFFWLVSLLIAVITSSFQIIREEGKVSAFTGEDEEEILEKSSAIRPQRPQSSLSKLFAKTKWVWLTIITVGLVVQALRSDSMSAGRRTFIDATETIVTLLLLIEIVLRFLVDWRNFFKQRRNLVDLFLAIITSVMQIPPIHNSGAAYAWLTIFQILRIYRLVLAIPLTRDLILIVTKNITALANQILFTFLLSFLAAILATQMFRGTLPQQDSGGNQVRTTFQTIWNSFLGMYQILSSENWTDIMYHVTEYTVDYNTAWMGAIFFIIWFILGFFIVLNMFIAVIQENFDVSEDEKRMKQVQAFLESRDGGSSTGTLSLSSVFKWDLISGKKRDALPQSNRNKEMLLKDQIVHDFLDRQEGAPLRSPDLDERPVLRTAPTAVVGTGTLGSWWSSFIKKVWHGEPNPFYSRLEFSRAYEELDPRSMAQEVVTAEARRKQAQRDYLRDHPNYNVSLYLFKPGNPLRRMCQKIVGPGRGGERIGGVNPEPALWYAFSAFIYAAIVAMVALACVTTPLYQKEYFQVHDFSVRNWFVFTDMGFAALFALEAAIKVIADGFFFTPNAYFRGSWGFIDGIVLLTLWINVATALFNEGQVSRAIGAFKALRALRLLNVSDSARNNFHAVIVRGGWKVLAAGFVSLSLLIPFAIYGLNLFVGKMVTCNDGSSSIVDLNACVDEYMSSPYNWNVLAPRQASNAYFSFDSFGESLFILFQTVSQEGWVDVMWRAQSITGVFQQQQPFASQGNAVFNIVFNLLGSVFVLTLFVSVFMRNYTEQTGIAFLTTDQRAWLELRKLLRQISPSKRPATQRQRKTFRNWCYKASIRKTGPWHRFITGMLVLHVVLLCLEWYPDPDIWNTIVDFLFILLQLLFIANIVIRIVGLSWARFVRSSWEIYSLFSVFGAFVTTVLTLVLREYTVLDRLNKLMLVSLSFLLIPRNNQLDQLFKTAAASLPLISNLMATWLVMFLMFAIALTQAFGLTRFAANESANVNFRTVPKALILLFRMSVGEGWNQIMEDFATISPPYCVVAPAGQSFDSDCGSDAWARVLLVAWNILSMYIFVNLFISLIYESFSYVYQRSSGLSVISREEIRRFKQAWAEYDPEGKGYIKMEHFPRLLGELSGVFEMRIYDGDFTVKRLLEDCSTEKRHSILPISDTAEAKPAREVDLDKLNARLQLLNVPEIRKRRARMNKFYEEVLVSADADKGIAFSTLLIILAHYKVINDNQSLRLEEFLKRRARLQRVDEAVRRNIVKGFFNTVFLYRRFKRTQDDKRRTREASFMRGPPNLNIPAIFVDDEDADTRVGAIGDDHMGQMFDEQISPGMMTPGSDEYGYGSDTMMTDSAFTATPNIVVTPERKARPGLAGSLMTTGLRREGSQDSIQRTPVATTSRNRGLSVATDPSHISPSSSLSGPSKAQPQGHLRNAPSDASSNWHLADAMSRPGSRPGSPTLGVHHSLDGGRSRAGSSVSAVSARDVLDVLDNSAWGESIRKSFSTRRGGEGE